MRILRLAFSATAPMMALALRAASLVAQASPGMAPLPADPPIGGVVWTVVIPAALFVGSFLGTYLLYRRFSSKEGEG